MDRLHFRPAKPTVFATAEAVDFICAASTGGFNSLDRSELRLVCVAASPPPARAFSRWLGASFWLQLLLHLLYRAFLCSDNLHILEEFFDARGCGTACPCSWSAQTCENDEVAPHFSTAELKFDL
jgi:hypothetical protein